MSKRTREEKAPVGLMCLTVGMIIIIYFIGSAEVPEGSKAESRQTTKVETVEVVEGETRMTAPDGQEFTAAQVVSRGTVEVPDNANFGYDPKTGERN